jgi:hypothetical protein
MMRMGHSINLLINCGTYMMFSRHALGLLSNQKVCLKQFYIKIYTKDKTDALRLAHFSIKEYLISEHIQKHSQKQIAQFSLSKELSHSVISQICLAYLLQFSQPQLDKNIEKSSPLAIYAAKEWIFM